MLGACARLRLAFGHTALAGAARALPLTSLAAAPPVGACKLGLAHGTTMRLHTGRGRRRALLRAGLWATLTGV